MTRAKISKSWSYAQYKNNEGNYVQIKSTDKVIDETVDNMIRNYGQQYKSNILKAKSDIKYYFYELELEKILESLRQARYNIFEYKQRKRDI